VSDYSINDHFLASAKLFELLPSISPRIEDIAIVMLKALREGGCIYWFGNGGSASDAEHLAAELSGKYAHDREPLNSISLTTNTSVLTAISNDFGYEKVFARQVEAHVRPIDIVVGISTSGTSKNVVLGLETAAKRQATTVLLTGEMRNGASYIHHEINVPSLITAHIQEAHITIGQAICGYIENAYL
jgi:D-sedoheptulose 7-phosphate isomerase